MASLRSIIKGDRHPVWLIDAIILSAAVYSKDPREELEEMEKDYGLPATAKYEFVGEEELEKAGFGGCKQTLVVVKSLAGGHYIVACRGTMDVSDALTDLNIVHRTLSLGEGAAHAGFLDRAKSIPLDYFRRLLIRNENVVLAGHSLGGAVASLLTLRLLEATGRWCHQQVQCYTFGSPFFADYRLARHINSRYKQHFVHIVSRADFVPKVMPLAYTLYSLWAGLQVGPLQDLFHCSRVFMLAMQLTKTRLKITQKFRLLAMASQTMAWLPALCRLMLQRLIALALSHHSGYSYAFAGQMVLLDPHTRAFELADRETWTLSAHLSFHLGGGLSLEEHSLISYIEHIFAVQAAEASASMAAKALTDSSAPNMKLHMTTINVKYHHNSKERSSSAQQNVKQTCLVDVSEEQAVFAAVPKSRNDKAIRALKSQVACVIFARRLQEASPTSFKLKQEMRRKKKRSDIFKHLTHCFFRFSRFVHRFDRLLLASSIVCAGVQINKFVNRN